MSDTAMELDEPSRSRSASPAAAPAGGSSSGGKLPITDMQTHNGNTAVRSIEGWIIMITNVHEEADDETIMDRFREFGEIKNMHLNLDRRSGYVKGYVLLEYATLQEARRAIDEAHGSEFLEQTINVDFAFVRPPPGGQRPRGSDDRHGGRRIGRGRGGGRGGGGYRGRGDARSRSRSPGRERERDRRDRMGDDD